MTSPLTSPGWHAPALLSRLWNSLHTRWRFKVTLPRLRTITLEGVRLDVSTLSSRMKNNLLLGRYEVQERTLVQEFVTAEDRVLEVGGAIGFIGLFCQTRLGVRDYTTVEANPGTVDLLRRNYALNGVTPRVWNLALAGEEGEVALQVDGDFWENSLLGAAGGGRTVRVPAVSLAGLVRRLDQPPTVLIVDIEGAEQFVDFREVPASVTRVIIELHPHLIGQERTGRIIADLVNLGFRVGRESAGTFLFLR